MRGLTAELEIGPDSQEAVLRPRTSPAVKKIASDAGVRAISTAAVLTRARQTANG
jgi:hypothetical protein